MLIASRALGVRILPRLTLAEGGCWIWTGGCNSKGYGKTEVSGRALMIHRVTYEMANGPIPAGLQVDHLCKVKSCANPSHLEVVTSRENTMRGPGPSALNAAKTHCKWGHEFTPENVYYPPSRPRSRICKPCRARRKRSARC